MTLTTEEVEDIAMSLNYFIESCNENPTLADRRDKRRLKTLYQRLEKEMGRREIQ